jgi:BirA family transcriptional regulator, biotin operon repressor / biotin---[acetyl-CoA-carboxylase] ligase
LRSSRFEPTAIADAIEQARGRLGRLGTTLAFFPSIGSTNDAAMAVAREGAVVIADEQTEGRGRRGHAWFSPAGSGLYVSVVLTPARARVDPRRATALLTLAAGVALAEGLQSSVSLSVDLKWPNDLYVARRKVGGILAEATRDTVVLGYGLNVHTVACPPELRDRATSIESELGRPVDRLNVLVETLAALARRYDDLLEGRFDAILEAWRRRAPSAHGTLVTWSAPSGVQSGITIGIDDGGALLVRVDDRVERIVGGELIWSNRHASSHRRR